MIEKKVTIQSLLNEDKRKRLAELLLNGDIRNMVVIYRKENGFHCETSEEVIASTVGMLDMVKTLVIEDWLHPERYLPDIDTDADQDNEEETS
jgi:hypothetical protein